MISQKAVYGTRKPGLCWSKIGAPSIGLGSCGTSERQLWRAEAKRPGSSSELTHRAERGWTAGPVLLLAIPSSLSRCQCRRLHPRP
jgi:hypothetical protein